MEDRMTRKERFFMYNTLLSLAKSLEKRCTTIDLRNDTYVTGTIQQVDGFMNVTLADAALFDTDGKHYYFPFMNVQARNIRNIHVPDNVNILKAIKDQVAVEVDKKKPVSKQRTLKQSRARKQQEETKELVRQMKEKMEKEKATAIESTSPTQDTNTSSQ